MSEKYNMDFGWRFHRGEPEDDTEASHSAVYMCSKAGNAGGAASREYDDSVWREVDLPHDYFTESQIGKEYMLSSGYRKPDNAWYRKTFLLDEALREKNLFLCFEGTAVNAEFYLNGSLMARSFSAYTETFFEITDRAYFGEKPNTLAVHINGFAKQGWWYEGAGIYRHVYLYAKNPVHISHNGVFVNPVLCENSENDWQVEIEAAIENNSAARQNMAVRCTIYDGERAIYNANSDEKLIDFFESEILKLSVPVNNPKRWDIDAPNLYSAQVEVLENGVLSDSEKVTFGFRTFFMDAEKGFFLNGRHLKIKGTCNHQDHAGVGVAVPDELQYYRVRLLKEMGSNAYRSAHNIPAKEVLNACDTLGMLVMDENRNFESSEENLENLRAMIKRDRNHPSVIFYSLFNEEPLQNTEEGAKMFRRMKNAVKKIDDTRLILGAVNSFEPYEGSGKIMDVIGINYGLFNIQNVIEKTHRLLPDKPIIGTETGSAVTTRGCYRTDKANKQVLSCYDEECVSWGNTISQLWNFARRNDWYSGVFVWTGFDYRGEPTPFKWPSVSSQFGILDTCGFKKASFYYYLACFKSEPIIHLIPHWNWKTGEIIRVVAITSCEEAELFLNGVSLGKKKADCCAQPEWEVLFRAGQLLAKGYINGKCAAEDRRVTTAEPIKIKAEPVRKSVFNDGQDVIIVNCSVLDAANNEVETAENELFFETTGGARLLGSGNGDPNSHEPDISPYRKLFAGKCQAIFRVLPNAENVRIRVSSKGLKEAVIVPAVLKADKLKFIHGIINYNIYGVTQSAVLKEKPNPLTEIADNDMNSFAAAAFSYEHFQYDFTAGWRIYRIKTKAISDKMLLVLQSVCASISEIYVNKSLLMTNTDMDGERIICPVFAKKDDILEIRIIMEGVKPSENGIKAGIQLIPMKEGKNHGDF